MRYDLPICLAPFTKRILFGSLRKNSSMRFSYFLNNLAYRFLPQKYINQFIPTTKRDFFYKNLTKKGTFSENFSLKKGLFP